MCIGSVRSGGQGVPTGTPCARWVTAPSWRGRVKESKTTAGGRVRQESAIGGGSRTAVRNLPRPRAKGGFLGAAKHRDVDRATDHRRAVPTEVRRGSGADAPGALRSRSGTDAYRNRCPGDHRSRKLGAGGECNRSAFTEGKFEERSEDSMITHSAVGRSMAWGLSAWLIPAAASAQTARWASERLSLDSAIQIALENNRQLRTTALNVNRADENVAVARTRRLPVFQTEVMASQLLLPVDFSFPRGACTDRRDRSCCLTVATFVTLLIVPVLYATCVLDLRIVKWDRAEDIDET